LVATWRALDRGLQLDEAQRATAAALGLDDVGADGRVLVLGAFGQASQSSAASASTDSSAGSRHHRTQLTSP
jgi:hypothetical protein